MHLRVTNGLFFDQLGANVSIRSILLFRAIRSLYNRSDITDHLHLTILARRKEKNDAGCGHFESTRSLSRMDTSMASRSSETEALVRRIEEGDELALSELFSR